MILLLLAATLLVTPEQPVSELRQGPARMLSSVSLWASNGETMLGVWEDDRGVQAARFDRSGSLLDPISIGLPLSSYPRGVFWNGEHWVVLNTESFVRIDADGNVVDRTPRALGLGLNWANTYRFTAVWTGSAALIVAEIHASDHHLFAFTVDRDMALVEKLQLTRGQEWRGAPWGLVSNQSSTVLFYSTVSRDPPQLRAAVFNRFGELERDRVIEEVYVHNAAVATDGEQFAIVYRPLLSHVWSGFSVDRDLNRQRFARFPTVDRSGVSMADLVFDGTVWTAYFTETEDGQGTVRAIRIGRDGRVLDRPPLIVFSYLRHEWVREYPRMASMGGMTFMFYKDRTVPYSFLPKVRAAQTAEAMAAAIPTDLSIGPFAQEAPVAVRSTTQSIVAWREEVDPHGAAPILATRIDAGGQIRDLRPLALGGSRCTAAPMAGATDGRDFLVAWREPDAIAGAVVRADGTTRPWRVVTEEVTFPCEVLQMAAASNGSTYLVLWTARGTFADRRELQAVRVSSDGTVVDMELMSLQSKPPRALVASDGRDFLIVAGNEVFRIASDGTSQELHGVRLGGTALGLWWNGSRYAVAVREEDESGVRLRFVGADGSDAGSTSLHPLTQFGALSGGVPECDARGCSYASSVDGLLIRTRLEEHRGQASVTSDSVVTPAFPSGPYAPRDVTLAGELLVYSRRVLEQGNVPRVFMLRIMTMRDRAVRH